MEPKMKSESSDLHRIIVVGGGAGGLELVTRLGDKLGRRKVADVTLIDKSRTHLWKPLLHEVAAGTMDFAVHEINFLAQAHWHGFHYRIGEMIGLDRQKREVHVAAHVDDEGRQVTPMRSFGYDMLVIAVGSQSNDFGTPGVREHAVGLDTPLEATRFHRRLVNAYIRGHAQPETLRPEQLNVAIIGAGATGTELAAELHYTTRQLVAYGLDRIDPDKDIKIHLIEAADHQSAGRAADAPDDPRREHIRIRRLCRLPLAGSSRHIRSAPCASCTPAGNTSGEANQTAPNRRAATAMAVSRFRLACLAWGVFNGRNPDGRSSRREPLDRGPVRSPHVPFALQAARICAARSDQGDIGHAWTSDHSPHRTAH
jgi:hypothetical protein